LIFDLNAGVFGSVFNEPVNPATLQGEALTIQDALTSMVSFSQEEDLRLHHLVQLSVLQLVQQIW